MIRSGNNTMFIHVLTFYHDSSNVLITTNVNINAWVGISFSKSHSSRDMFAFVTANGKLMDMYSLYYNAPYEDASINVVGADNLLSIAESNTYTNGNDTHYFYGGMSREYNTGDAFGDEIIRKKMNNTYCYAIGFSTNNNSVPYYPNVSTNIHHDFECFTAYVTLTANRPVVTTMLILALLMIVA